MSDKPVSETKEAPNEYRIVLVGRTGEGKSAAGNTIFGSKIFKSSASSGSVTTDCHFHRQTVNGRNLLVVDTPGLFDTGKDNEETKKEILNFVGMTSPGPHVILIVMKIARFTKEVQESYQELCKILGKDGHPYTIIVLNNGDDLENDGKSIEEYIQNATAGLKVMLTNVEHRYVVFNNREKDEKKMEEQVNRLLDKIDKLVWANKGDALRSGFYTMAEKALVEKETEARDALKKKKDVEQNKLKERLKEKQAEIESFHLERQRSLRVKKQLEHREEQMLTMQRVREYEDKIASINRELDAKSRSLEDQYKKDLISVRDRTRQEINANPSKVSESWFKGKLKRFLNF